MSVGYRVEQLDKGKPRKRCRRWTIAVRTRERYANGRVKWARSRFEGSYTEACDEAERLAAGYADGTEALPSRWTFEGYAEHWNAAKLASGEITLDTHKKNANLLRLFCMHFGTLKLTDVMPSHVEQAYAKLRAGESPSGKDLSGTTLRGANAVGYSMMEHAIASGLATSNPFAKCMVPKGDTPERKALGIAEEVQLALSLDPCERHQMALIMMLEAGLRRGECCALRWRDVEGGRVEVHATMRIDRTEGMPKGGRSRAVPMSATLAESLDKWRATWDEESVIGPSTSSGYVLADQFGDPMNPQEVGRWWRRHRAEFGMEEWTPHEFRHTYCSNLAEADVHPKVMQRLMGHASERTSLKVYTHVQDGQLSRAMDSLDACKEQARSDHDTTMTQIGAKAASEKK